MKKNLLVIVLLLFYTIQSSIYLPDVPTKFKNRASKNPLLSFSFSQLDCSLGNVIPSDQNNVNIQINSSYATCPSRGNFSNAVVGVTSLNDTNPFTLQTSFVNTAFKSYTTDNGVGNYTYLAFELFFSLVTLPRVQQPNMFLSMGSVVNNFGTLYFVVSPDGSNSTTTGDYINIVFIMYSEDPDNPNNTVINEYTNDFEPISCNWEFAKYHFFSNQSSINKLVYLAFVADGASANGTLYYGIQGEGLTTCTQSLYSTNKMRSLVLANLSTLTISSKNQFSDYGVNADVHFLAFYDKNNVLNATDSFYSGLPNSVPSVLNTSSVYLTLFHKTLVFPLFNMFDYDLNLINAVSIVSVQNGLLVYYNNSLVVSFPFLASNLSLLSVGGLGTLTGFDVVAPLPNYTCTSTLATAQFKYKVSDSICNKSTSALSSPGCLSITTSTANVCVLDENIPPVTFNYSFQIEAGSSVAFNLTVTDANDYQVGRIDNIPSIFGINSNAPNASITFIYTNNTFITSSCGGNTLLSNVRYRLNTINSFCYSIQDTVPVYTDTSISYYFTDNKGLNSNIGYLKATIYYTLSTCPVNATLAQLLYLNSNGTGGVNGNLCISRGVKKTFTPIFLQGANLLNTSYYFKIVTLPLNGMLFDSNKQTLLNAGDAIQLMNGFMPNCYYVGNLDYYTANPLSSNPFQNLNGGPVNPNCFTTQFPGCPDTFSYLVVSGSFESLPGTYSIIVNGTTNIDASLQGYEDVTYQNGTNLTLTGLYIYDSNNNNFMYGIELEATKGLISIDKNFVLNSSYFNNNELCNLTTIYKGCVDIQIYSSPLYLNILLTKFIYHSPTYVESGNTINVYLYNPLPYGFVSTSAYANPSTDISISIIDILPSQSPTNRPSNSTSGAFIVQLNYKLLIVLLLVF